MLVSPFYLFDVFNDSAITPMVQMMPSCSLTAQFVLRSIICGTIQYICRYSVARRGRSLPERNRWLVIREDSEKLQFEHKNTEKTTTSLGKDYKVYQGRPSSNTRTNNISRCTIRQPCLGFITSLLFKEELFIYQRSRLAFVYSSSIEVLEIFM